MACDAYNEISSQKANEKDSSHAISCSFIHFLLCINSLTYNSGSIIYLFDNAHLIALITK